MRNTKRVGASDELAAVPERDRWRHRQHIDDQGNKACNSSKNMLIPFFVDFHSA